MRRGSLLAILWIFAHAAGQCVAADRAAGAGVSLRMQPRPVRQGQNQQILVAADVPVAKTVEMVIDYGDGVQLRFTALPWREKMTVLDAVSAASTHPHGVKCVWRGAGSTAFVTQIGDQKNEGGGAKNRNWLFSVNDKESDVGIGDSTLKAGDAILWRFGVLNNNDRP